MANRKQLAILKRGVDAWNAWRRDNPKVKPSLSNADLRHSVLRQANLRGASLLTADLTSTDLRRADLRQAKLFLANLTDSNLRGANLGGADLIGADLSRACLINANLSDAELIAANLTGANLFRAMLFRSDLTRATLTLADLTKAQLGSAKLHAANLNGSNLTSAYLAHTILADTNLTSAIGLDLCIHHEPSIIDFRTLRRSGMLPIPFLRGCGLPDELIDVLPSLLKQQKRFYSCFISYSAKDDRFVRRLYADLQNNGVRCWFAPEHMKIGNKIRHRIDQAIHVHEKLLLILSEDSIQSDWVENEVEAALDQETQRNTTVLFPIRLDDAIMHSQTAWAATIRRTRHIGDFTKWRDDDVYHESLERLLRDLLQQPQTT